jgi:hypothetical protein
MPGIKVAIASGNLELVGQEYDAVFSKPHDIPLIASKLRQGLLDAARRGNCTKVPYRCDTPRRRRSWIMEFKLEEQCRLSIVHRLVEDAPLLSSVVFRTATEDFIDAIPRCSVCNHIFTNGTWREADDASPDKSGRESLNVIYEVCPACNFLVLRTLNT